MPEGGAKSSTILVVGGGIAGISTAVEAAEAGCQVVLLESTPTLGGRVAGLNRYFPKLCHPTCGLEIHYKRLRDTPSVKVLTLTTVERVVGSRGAFTVTLRTRPRHVNARCTACGDCAAAAQSEIPNPFNHGLDRLKAAYLPHQMAYPMRYVVDGSVIGTPEADRIRAACKYDAVDLEETGNTFELAAGAIVWATGWRPYDAARITPYGYDRLADVINNLEMERLAAADGPTAGNIVRPSDGRAAKRVAFIQCAGSRDLNHLPYCSRICCLASMKQAAYVRQQYAEAEIDIFYIDIRVHDKLEDFQRRLEADPQVAFVKSKPGSVVLGGDGSLVVEGEDTLSGLPYRRSYDLVVLATGMEPSTSAEAPPVELETDDYGFIVPADGVGDGMTVAGVAGGPLDVSMSVQSACAAALRAIQAVEGDRE